MLVYIDESGDLGWKFDQPYRAGGSSRYLNISFLIVPNQHKDKPKRIIRSLYSKYHIPTSQEIKGADLNEDQRTFFVSRVVRLLTGESGIRIVSITVNKENVAPHIRTDGNKLYNYMIDLALSKHIKSEPKVTLIPDPRTIKVKSGNSMFDYLQIKLWFDHKVPTILDWKTVHSDQSLNLKFVDMIAHIVWCYYEDKRVTHARILFKHIQNKRLFF